MKTMAAIARSFVIAPVIGVCSGLIILSGDVRYLGGVIFALYLDGLLRDLQGE